MHGRGCEDDGADVGEAALAMPDRLEEALHGPAPNGPISADQHQPTQAEQVVTLGKEAARMTLPLLETEAEGGVEQAGSRTGSVDFFR